MEINRMIEKLIVDKLCVYPWEMDVLIETSPGQTMVWKTYLFPSGQRMFGLKCKKEHFLLRASCLLVHDLWRPVLTDMMRYLQKAYFRQRAF